MAKHVDRHSTLCKVWWALSRSFFRFNMFKYEFLATNTLQSQGGTRMGGAVHFNFVIPWGQWSWMSQMRSNKSTCHGHIRHFALWGGAKWTPLWRSHLLLAAVYQFVCCLGWTTAAEGAQRPVGLKRAQHTPKGFQIARIRPANANTCKQLRTLSNTPPEKRCWGSSQEHFVEQKANKQLSSNLSVFCRCDMQYHLPNRVATKLLATSRSLRFPKKS